jgi:UDP-N-acetylmuramoyl-L-alanyl-D-glutamate--2,6-diaminopimelate ligase
MLDLGAKSIVMEISSHALALNRVKSLMCDFALFTNLSRDHLDFHNSFEDYFEAKLKLFTDHLKDSNFPRAAVNLDDPFGEKIKERLGSKALSYGFTKGEVLGRVLREDRAGILLEISFAGVKATIDSKLLGSFNAENILGAFALSLLITDSYKEGVLLSKLNTIILALSENRGAMGRMERVGNSERYLALVDYAHSPKALEAVIKASRKLVKGSGRLIVVFGCGGDRDRGKRPEMAEAATYSDIPILTSDNPRTEDPYQIMEDAEKGLSSNGLILGDLNTIKRGDTGESKGRIYLKELDRRKAIFMGASLLEEDDVLLICGKGHEDYQIIGREKFPFSDSLEAKKALDTLGKN